MPRSAIALRALHDRDLERVQRMQARSFAALGVGANTAEQIQAHVDEIMAPAYRAELLANHMMVAEDKTGTMATHAGVDLPVVFMRKG